MDLSEHAVQEILRSFTAAERDSFLRELDRRTAKLPRKLSKKTLHHAIVEIIVEEIDMVLVARNA
jgi:hypothetical protein